MKELNMNESSAREMVVWRGPMQTFDNILSVSVSDESVKMKHCEILKMFFH